MTHLIAEQVIEHHRHVSPIMGGGFISSVCYWLALMTK
jgi:hypothetical protein